MVKEIKGPWGIILIGPSASNYPYKPWDRNQGTYLAIALAVPLFLTLFATISVPIIPGAYLAKVIPANATHTQNVVYGTWGMCITGLNQSDFVDDCTPYTVIGGNETLLALPQRMWNLTVPISKADGLVPDDFKMAMGVMHALAVMMAWIASASALAASGEWHAKGVAAWSFTRFAWGAEMASLVMGIVPWALEIAMFDKIKNSAKMIGSLEDQSVQVKPGPTIYMLSAAILSHLILALVRVFWSKREPRPIWTLEGQRGDFHSKPAAGTGSPDSRHHAAAVSGLRGLRADSVPAALDVPAYGAGLGGEGMGMPNSAGLIGDDEKPPTWESLNLDSAVQVTDDKHWPSVEDSGGRR